MGKITATKEYIKDVLGISNLRIPEYQRPYRWNDTNVRQLLEDIKSSFYDQDVRHAHLPRL